MGEERIYHCQVKVAFLQPSGEKVRDWKTVPVTEVIEAGHTEVRCKDCWGAVKVFRKHKANAPAPHVEHKHRQDSEICPSGHYFKGVPKTSTNPVR